MAEAPKTDKLVVRNIGLMLSGDLESPVLDADTLVAEDGRIAAFGREKDLDIEGASTVVDARWTTLCPDLIDSHVHPVAGDWTPRQSQLHWIDSSLNGGVTTMISAGEVHMPGRPRDIVGLKALAVSSQRTFENFRPNGVKVHAGAPVIEQGMEEQDFIDLAAAGVKLLGEVGLGSVKAGEEAERMVGWARKHGIQSTIHTGGPSIPGSGLIDKDVILQADPDVIGHINGGHTAIPTTRSSVSASSVGAGSRSSTTETSGRVSSPCGPPPSWASSSASSWAPTGQRARASSRSGSCVSSPCSRASARCRPSACSASRPAIPRGCGSWTAG